MSRKDNSLTLALSKLMSVMMTRLSLSTSHSINVLRQWIRSLGLFI